MNCQGLIEANFPTNGKRSIMGAFNGRARCIGIGTTKPRTLSKCFCFFAYFIAKPRALGEKAFTAYLGKDREKWQQYDASSLIQQGYKVQGMRIDQGLEDEFLPTQLRTEGLSKPVVRQINRSMCVSTRLRS